MARHAVCMGGCRVAVSGPSSDSADRKTLGQGAVLEPGLLRALEGGNAGWGRAFGLGFGFSLGCTADGNGSGGG